jgi:phage terminase Nu1 subunit (DNA packaging protein)
MKKKTSYFNVVTHHVKQINYEDALTTKEVRPMLKSEDNDEVAMKKKLKEKYRLEKLQAETSSLEKIRHKLIVIKNSERRLELEVVGG